MKKEPMADDHDREMWLGPMLRQGPTAVSDPCIDAESLAAWAEGKLDTTQAGAVELHASNCQRCMAMLASMARTTPAEEERKASWSRAVLMRWLVPLTAAATAIAIWVLVPDRPVTQVPSATVPHESAPQESAAAGSVASTSQGTRRSGAEAGAGGRQAGSIRAGSIRTRAAGRARCRDPARAAPKRPRERRTSC